MISLNIHGFDGQQRDPGILEYLVKSMDIKGRPYIPLATRDSLVESVMGERVGDAQAASSPNIESSKDKVCGWISS